MSRTVGPNNASTFANFGGGVAWATPGNAALSDNAYATAVLALGDASQTLKCTGFGFSIPPRANIIGVKLEVERSQTGGGADIRDNQISLFVGGSPEGDNKADTATTWPGADAYKTYGGATDTWGLGTLTPAIVNASDFGIGVRAEALAAGTARVDHVRVTVYWELPFLFILDLSLQNNLTAKTEPTVNDDSGDGYAVGSVWINILPEYRTIYACSDATPGAAVWDDVTAYLSNLKRARQNHSGYPLPDLAICLYDPATSDTFCLADAAALAVRTKIFTISRPSASEDGPEFYTETAYTLSEMRAVLVGSATPSVTWTIRYGADRSAAGTEVVTGGTTTTNVTTGHSVTVFNNGVIPAGNFVWIETTARSGNVNSLGVTLKYSI